MGQAGPGPTQWGKPALCPSPTSPGKIQPVLSLVLAHYQSRRWQSRRKHGCRELKAAEHTPGGPGGRQGESTTRDRHLGAPLRLPKRLVSTPSPGRAPSQNHTQGPLKSFNVYWKCLCARFGPSPQGTHSLGERTHNQHNALCKCRGRRADPGPERQSLLNLLGRPGGEENSPGIPGGWLRSAHEASGPGRAPHSQEVAQAGLCPGDDAREAGARRRKDVRGAHGAQEREAMEVFKEGPHQGCV